MENFHVSQHSSVVAGSRVVDPVIHHGGKTLRIDGNLPSSLTKLLPFAWGNAPKQAWIPFIRRAILLGKL